MTRDQKIKLAARAGYAARGVVYLLVGGFAVEAALGSGGQARGSEQALSTLAGGPIGTAALAAIAAGLLGYAGWRFLQSAFDFDSHGTDAKGLAVRGGLMVSAFTHTLLAIYAAHLAFGTSAGAGGGSSSSDVTAQVFALPAGRWLVGAAALAIAGAGIAHVIKGWTKGFLKWMAIDGRAARWAEPVCQVGLIARGVVFVVIAGLLAKAALEFDSREAGGLVEALRTLQAQPMGATLFALIALGLFAFGVYSLIEAAYRRVEPSGMGSGGSASSRSRILEAR